MDSALAWIGQVAEWLGAFFPRWVVLDTATGAVKFVKGQPKFCEPGAVHWFWPVTTLWQTYPVVRQTDRLESQTIETTDGKTFIVAGTITYRGGPDGAADADAQRDDQHAGTRRQRCPRHLLRIHLG
jgi:hypothetical protein